MTRGRSNSFITEEQWYTAFMYLVEGTEWKSPTATKVDIQIGGCLAAPAVFFFRCRRL